MGVDRDQLQGYYHCRTKSRKFYKYISTWCSHHQRFHSDEEPHKQRLQDDHQGLSAWVGIRIDRCSHHRRWCTSSSIRSLPLWHFPVKVDDSCPLKIVLTAERLSTVTWTPADFVECSAWLCHLGDPNECFCSGIHTYIICRCMHVFKLMLQWVHKSTLYSMYCECIIVKYTCMNTVCSYTCKY